MSESWKKVFLIIFVRSSSSINSESKIYADIAINVVRREFVSPHNFLLLYKTTRIKQQIDWALSRKSIFL